MDSVVYNEDCMIGMSRYPDNYFDLAVVDPPYGIDYCSNGDGVISRGKPQAAALNNYKSFDDTEPPNNQYFDELIRVSKHQIIFGGQHFTDKLPKRSKWIVWDKIPSGCDGQFSGLELAWTSFKGSIDRYNYKWQGMLQGNMKEKEQRIHPTQKPVKLYDWIYKNYLPDGGRVIDTHLGSGSNRIAAHKAGNIEFTGFELDTEYYEAAEKRFKEFTSQLTLF